jgi:hypothetical protein
MLLRRDTLRLKLLPFHLDLLFISVQNILLCWLRYSNLVRYSLAEETLFLDCRFFRFLWVKFKDIWRVRLGFTFVKAGSQVASR